MHAPAQYNFPVSALPYELRDGATVILRAGIDGGTITGFVGRQHADRILYWSDDAQTTREAYAEDLFTIAPPAALLRTASWQGN